MNNRFFIQHPLHLTSQLPFWHLQNKNVLLRVDLNVTLVDGQVTDYNDAKLQASLPTIEYLLQQQARHIVLLTHIGNPKRPDPALSTKLLTPWFAQHGLHPVFIQTMQQLHDHLISDSPRLLLFENLRFFPEEKQVNLPFAQQLAQHIDLYVNDAFGTVHRSETSMTLLAEQFNADKRTIGFLIEKELKTLNDLLHKPQRPVLLFLGGKKAHDKINILTRILPLVDGIFLLPALVFSFLESQGKSTGASLVDPSAFELCNELIAQARQLNIPLYFPEDYYVDKNGQFSQQTGSVFDKESKGICIGPKTIERWKKQIEQAGTIVSNGAQGFIERPETLVGTKALYEAFLQSSAKTIIAGGDSIAMAQYLALTSNQLVCSTGGGATLAYLAGMPLPGLAAFKK